MPKVLQWLGVLTVVLGASFLLSCSPQKSSQVQCPPTRPYTYCTLPYHADILARYYLLAFSPDSFLVASHGLPDQRVVEVRLWEVASGKEVMHILSHREWVSSVVFSPNGSLLASGDWGGEIKLWEVGSGQEIRTLRGHSEGGMVVAVSFSADGQLLASITDTGEIKLWEVATGHELRTIVACTPTPTKVSGCAMHGTDIPYLAFSPDGKLFAYELATGDFEETIKLVKVATGQEVRAFTFVTNYGGPLPFFFSPDGRLVAVAMWQKAELWEVATGRLVRTVSSDKVLDNGLAFSYDGRLLAKNAAYCTWYFKDTSRNSLDFMPFGCADHRTIELFEVASGKRLHILSAGPSEPSGQMVFSPDGRLLASFSSPSEQLGRGTDILLWYVGNLTRK